LAILRLPSLERSHLFQSSCEAEEVTTCVPLRLKVIIGSPCLPYRNGKPFPPANCFCCLWLKVSLSSPIRWTNRTGTRELHKPVYLMKYPYNSLKGPLPDLSLPPVAGLRTLITYFPKSSFVYSMTSARRTLPEASQRGNKDGP